MGASILTNSGVFASITARQGSAEVSLATATVNVNTNGCFFLTYAESALREEINKLIDSNLDLEESPLSKRSPTQIKVNRDGIRIKLRLKLDVPNFFDPNVDVNMLLRLRANNNDIVVSVGSYSSDVD